MIQCWFFYVFPERYVTTNTTILCRNKRNGHLFPAILLITLMSAFTTFSEQSFNGRNTSTAFGSVVLHDFKLLRDPSASSNWVSKTVTSPPIPQLSAIPFGSITHTYQEGPTAICDIATTIPRPKSPPRALT